MEAGAPLVPVFVFGQMGTWHWWRPPLPAALLSAFSRKAGCVPLALWGRWGTAVPHASPMTVVIGAPIAVPHMPRGAGGAAGGGDGGSKANVITDAQAQPYLDAYIAAIEALFKKHRAAAGYPDMELRVI